MLDTPTLKQCLLNQTGLTEEQFYQAEDYALTRSMTLEDALLFLEFVDYGEMGQCLASIYGRPYLPLLDKTPVQEAKIQVPVELAERLAVFPLRADVINNRLMLAVNDPTDHELKAELKMLFGDVRLAFSVASAAEIKLAIEIHYRGKSYSPAQKIEVPEDFIILPSSRSGRKAPVLETGSPRSDRSIVMLEPDRRRARAIRTLLECEGYEKIHWAVSPEDTAHLVRKEKIDILMVNNTFFRPHGDWLSAFDTSRMPGHVAYYDMSPLLLGQEYGYEQMSTALIDMVAFWVGRSLQQKKELLRETVTRVKYCKLFGIRWGLLRNQLDALVLAAWLASGKLVQEVARQVATPFRVHEILSTLGANGQGRVESTILTMVTRYQGLVRSSPEAAEDMARVRKTLLKGMSAKDSEAMVETFLKVLKDEAFLGRVGQKDGVTILIIDPEVTPISSVVLRLSNEGYRVETARTAQKGMERVAKGDVGLVLTEAELEEGDGLGLCRALKEDVSTSGVPVLFLATEEEGRLQAECLAAGADDFLKKPVDLEVLTLKVHRLLSTSRPPQESSRGVRGSLLEMSSVDFLQSLSAGEKDVEIRLRQDEQQGRIFMQGGTVVHAELGPLSGEEAFYTLIGWDTGDFEILACSDFPSQTVEAPLELLLIEGYRRKDEQQNQPGSA